MQELRHNDLLRNDTPSNPLGMFASGLWDETAGQAYNGISQIINAGTGTEIHRLAGASAADRQSLAHKAGGFAGMLAEFVLISRAIKPISTQLAGKFGQKAESALATSLNLGLAGSFQSGLLHESAGSNLLAERGRAATVDFLTFGAMGALSHRLAATEKFAGESFKALTLRNGIAGGTSGFVHAEATALLTDLRLASKDELLMDAGTGALFGAGFGAAQFGLAKLISPGANNTRNGEQIESSTHRKNTGNIGEQIDSSSPELKFLRTPPQELAPHIERDLRSFQEIFKPAMEPGLPALEQTKRWNAAVMEGNDFVRSHRSIYLEDAVKDWSQRAGSQELRGFVDWAYSPKLSRARRSNYLMDLAIEEAKTGQHGELAKIQLMQVRGKFQDRVNSHTISQAQHDVTVENVLRLMENGYDPRLHTAELRPASQLMKKAALQMTMQAAEPTRIVQNWHPTCALASLEVDMYTRFPEHATRAVAEVMRTGKFVTADGTTIKIDARSLGAEYGTEALGHVTYRSYASQIFQTLASNIHWQTQTVNPLGKPVPRGSLIYELIPDIRGIAKSYIVDYSVPGAAPVRTPARGYFSHEVEEIGRQFGGDKTKPRYVPKDVINTPEDLAKYLTDQRADSNWPKIISIDANHIMKNPDPNVRAGHAVTVLRPFNSLGKQNLPVDSVAMHNTWNASGDPQFLTVRELWVLTQPYSRIPETIRLR